jgi:type I restriction enzyme R subunit
MSAAERFRSRHLPHWDVPHAAYFITSCLEGSIPARGQLDIRRYRTSLERRPRPASKSPSEWRIHCWKLVFGRTDEWLDRQPAARHLGDPQLAQLVVDALYFFAGQRYDLLAFVVMPSHLHWVFQPLPSWVNRLGDRGSARTVRERIVHSLNRYTAAACNKLQGGSGTFWQHESYDHWVRDAEELERVILYVEGNPVKAGLVAAPELWPFSSAHDRRRAGTEIGVPLVRAPKG